MKNFWILNMIAMALSISHNSNGQETNDFYDDAETFDLNGKTTIQIAGEIANPGVIDITSLEKRSLIIKEALIHADTNRFIGAYRYDGYSLYDILNTYILKKTNNEEFPPIIDLYVEVEDEKGNSVFISWGEIYYPIHRHEIIIATRVTRIVPSKTRDLWPLPENIKLVVGSDLITERNISNPVKITIHSARVTYPIHREMSPLYSNMLTIDDRVKLTDKSDIPANTTFLTYESVFYGRGRGIHSTTPFHGYLLKDVLDEYFSFDQEAVKKGLFVIASVDGYRSVFTFSEIMNRNDQAEVLLVFDPENKDGGAFRLFPAADFFSDRAVKAVSEIRMLKF